MDKIGSAGPIVVALRQRLLRDIAELQEKPYPNIRLHVDDDDLTTACLILTPENLCKGLHLTVHFRHDYPLRAPQITMQSKVNHPNVFGSYICASILNTEEGYTPAYTLKGIAIQLLSFFGSDRLEQQGGGIRELNRYLPRAQDHSRIEPRYRCEKCRFGCGSSRRKASGQAMSPEDTAAVGVNARSLSSAFPTEDPTPYIASLPDEILLLILEELESEELTLLAQAWPRIGRMITGYDLIRRRELQCFVVKKGHGQVDLGIGVDVDIRGRQGTIQSEFDLISRQAVHELAVRKSIHGIPFWMWLPLPIAHAHWRRVQQRVPACLLKIALEARFPDPGLVLYGFMNDIVIRLNEDIDDRIESYHSSKSTLVHASEKAIESYFHLSHLLLCLATSPAGQGMVPAANKMIIAFMAGKTTKAHVPNLGYLLIALLISDVEVTEGLMKAIITEAITRNVVWLLDQKGAGMAELAYLEADQISDYRLQKTFEGSKTSYRLLMFSELFRKTARPKSPAAEEPAPPGLAPSPAPPATTAAPTQSYSAAAASPPRQFPAPPQAPPGGKTSLVQLRDELFDRLGAPPPGAATRLASEVRRLQKINDFPSFLREMGIAAMPSRSTFTELLRSTLTTSHARGYSKAAISQPAALALRLAAGDRTLDRGLVQGQMDGWGSGLPDPEITRRRLLMRKVTFFPGEWPGQIGGSGGRGKGR